MEAAWWSAGKCLDTQRDRNIKADMTLLQFVVALVELGVKVGLGRKAYRLSWTVASRHGVVVSYSITMKAQS